MVVPEYQDGKSDDSMITLQKVPDVSANTRKAGGQEPSEATMIIPKIIVDIREFRSDLPCLIHRRGLDVVPLTITVVPLNIPLWCSIINRCISFCFRLAITF